jgi:hypothetical protein
VREGSSRTEAGRSPDRFDALVTAARTKDPGPIPACLFAAPEAACFPSRRVGTMDIHRIVLYLSLWHGSIVLVLNALSVVTDHAWLFSR